MTQPTSPRPGPASPGPTNGVGRGLGLQREDWQGPAWEEFAEALVAYAYQCLLGWIRSGLIV